MRVMGSCCGSVRSTLTHVLAFWMVGENLGGSAPGFRGAQSMASAGGRPRAPRGRAPVDPPPTAAGQSPQLLRNPPWKSSPRWVRSTGALPSPGLSFPTPPKRTAQGLGGKHLGRWGRGRLAQWAQEESAAHSLLLHGGGDFSRIRRLCQVRGSLGGTNPF